MSIIRKSLDEPGIWTLDSWWLGNDGRGRYLHAEVSANLDDQAIIESISKDLEALTVDPPTN